MGLLLDTLNSVDFLSGMGEDAVVRFMVLGRSAWQDAEDFRTGIWAGTPVEHRQSRSSS